jgi:hypothetical protein
LYRYAEVLVVRSYIRNDTRDEPKMTLCNHAQYAAAHGYRFFDDHLTPEQGQALCDDGDDASGAGAALAAAGAAAAAAAAAGLGASKAAPSRAFKCGAYQRYLLLVNAMRHRREEEAETGSDATEAEGRVEWIVYLDTDIVIRNMSVTAEDIVNLASGGGWGDSSSGFSGSSGSKDDDAVDLVVARDPIWSETAYGPSNYPHPVAQVNSGAMLIRATSPWWGGGLYSF